MTESVMASLEVPDVGNTVYGIQLRADSRNYHDNHDDHSLFLVVISLTDSAILGCFGDWYNNA